MGQVWKGTGWLQEPLNVQSQISEWNYKVKDLSSDIQEEKLLAGVHHLNSYILSWVSNCDVFKQKFLKEKYFLLYWN